MSDIIREVDEELRREDWENVWKKYGKYAIVAAVAIVAVTAAVVGWREYQVSQRLGHGDNFAVAVTKVENSEIPEEAAGVMAEFAVGAPAGYAALARFREAKYRADANDPVAAIALYDQLSSDSSVEPMLRDLATLYSVRMQIDGGDRDSLLARLEPLTADSNTWRYSAREITAVLALVAGDTEAARQTYALLADDLEAPPSLRSRATEMLRALGATE